MSSKALGDSADLSAALGSGDGGVPNGGALLRFAEAATRGSQDLPESRRALIEVLGQDAFVVAAATVGIFSGLVRTADSIGIPLDDGMVRLTEGLRGELGLNEFGGSRNTDLDPSHDREPGGQIPSLVSD